MTLKAVVLGGTGFVGRYICQALREARVQVVPVSTSTTVPIDLSDPSAQERLAALLAEQGAHVLVNAAGKAWRSDEQQMHRANAALVERLIGAVLAQRVRPRLVHIGTIHEYGMGQRGAAFAEDAAPHPVLPYGKSKLLGTQTILDASAREGLDAVVLRVANVSGPGTPQGSLLRAVADHLAECAKAQANKEVLTPLRYRSLAAWRDFVDVRDVARAVFTVVTAADTGLQGQIFNIGRGEAVQVRWLVNQMVALSGLPVPVIEDDPAAGEDWQQLDIGKVGRALGWKPEVALERSLADLIEP